MTATTQRPAAAAVLGTDVTRLDAEAKVRGEARYAAEVPAENRAYAWPVCSTVARGRVAAVDAAAALAVPGVLAVVTAADAPRLADAGDAELLVLQGDDVRYRGQVVALVVADTLEAAREGGDSVVVTYDHEAHDVVLRTDHPQAYTPEKVNPAFPSETSTGDVDGALAAAPHTVDATYETPAEFNNPMEPHATTARWLDDGSLLLHDSTQSAFGVAGSLATLFGLEPEQVRVVSQHVGGGFGAKGSARPNAVLAAIGARHVGRPVTLSLARMHQFTLVGYRTPTVQRVRLGADDEGRLLAVEHTAWSQTSRLLEFAEQTAVVTRGLYATPAVRTGHRLVALDVPTPRWMRAPGEAPGAFALETAMNELAAACGVDPVELRVRNDTAVEPEGGKPYTSRHLVECLRRGAERFGWDGDRTPRARPDGDWLVGHGVATSTYPVYQRPCTATATARPDGSVVVEVAAADIGTGARTVLWQSAVDTLRRAGAAVEPAAVEVRIADSAFGQAPGAGGSGGTSSWSRAVVRVCEALVARTGGLVPAEDVQARVDTADEVEALADAARAAYGAQFVEARVNPGTGEVRVSRMVGVFAAGRILNPRTARSQLVGGMTMGLGMALHEEGLVDPRFGHVLNHDLAQYHVPVNADVPDIDATWLDEDDDALNPLGVKGIGEIGIVGCAAAVAEAVWHATGTRHRRLPIRPDRVLEG